ncbi:hypothetical protein OS11_30830 [Dickeya oryzae]
MGAAGGELTARLLIMKELYGGRDTSDLTEAEKQSVSALASLAAGLTSGIASGSVEGAATGAQAGRNAVENNFLGKTSSDKLFAAIEKIKAGDKSLATANELITSLLRWKMQINTVKCFWISSSTIPLHYQSLNRSN